MKVMSLAHAKQFISSIEADSVLQSRVIASHWNTGVILREAAVRKYSFTAAEIETVLDETFGVLAEDVLFNAAGGKNDDAGNDKHPNPPPGQNPDRGSWSPPPGDVSGNSCLFGWRG